MCIDSVTILRGGLYAKDSFAFFKFFAADVALGFIVYCGHDCGSVPAGVFQE
jgi:hypothetical protein